MTDGTSDIGDYVNSILDDKTSHILTFVINRLIFCQQYIMSKTKIQKQVFTPFMKSLEYE